MPIRIHHSVARAMQLTLQGRARAVACVLFAALVPIAAVAAQDPGAVSARQEIRLSTRREVLANGMTVILAPDPGTPLAAVRLFYRVGSRNEQIGKTGVAHLFEHMMFNGAEKYGPKQFDAVLERAGGSGNAVTTRDFTCYTTEVPPESLPVVFDLEADRMRGLRIDADILGREIQVVLEERRETLEDQPRELLEALLYASLFRAHPYRWPVLGWTADVAGATVEDCRAFYRTYYAPNNAVLVVAGAFDEARVLELARERFGALPAGPPVPPVPADEPPREDEQRLLLRREVPHATLLMGFVGPRARDADHPAVTLLQQVLAGGRASRLDRRLVQQERLATSVSIDHHWYVDREPVVVRVELVPGKDPALAERILREELARIVTDDVDADELQRARTAVTAGLLRNLQTLGTRAFLIGMFEITAGDHRGFLQLPDAYAAVDAARLRAVASRLLRLDAATVAVLVPKGMATPSPSPSSTASAVAPAPSPPAAVAHDAAPPPAPPPARRADAPRSSGPEVAQLENGMRLVRFEQEALPLVTFVVGLAGGSARDGVERAGLGSLLLDALWMGAGDLDEHAVQEALDAIGGQAGSFIEPEHAVVHLSCLASHAATGLELLHAALTRPRLTEDVVLREREQALARLAQAKNDPSWLANDAYVRAWLGDHPYAAALAGPTEASLQRITPELVRRAWERRLRPEATTLLVLGPADPEFDARVRAAFAGWKSAAAAEPLAALPPVPDGSPATRVLRVPRPDMGQIWLQFGALGLARNDPRRPAVALFQQAMAGGFTSVLVDELRVDRGLVYGVSLSQPWLSQPAPYSFVTATRAEKVAEVLDVTQQAVRAVRQHPFTQAQLEAARNTWLVARANGLQTPLGLALATYDGLLHENDVAAHEKRAARVRQLTAEDLAAVAELFEPAEFVVAMVGEAEALQQARVLQEREQRPPGEGKAGEAPAEPEPEPVPGKRGG